MHEYKLRRVGGKDVFFTLDDKGQEMSRLRHRGRKVVNKETGEITYIPLEKTQLEQDIEDAEDKLDNLCFSNQTNEWQDAFYELVALEKEQADFEADL